MDAHRVAQASTTLLVKALRHGDPDQPVAVRVAAEPAQIWLSVLNYGSAIAPEVVPHLFEAARRDRGRVSRGCRGSLGLFIVDQVARGHGGEV